MKAPNHLAFQHASHPPINRLTSVSESAFADTATHEIQTPETTKPLTSLEIRGFAYIEFGGEGEIRNHPIAIFAKSAPGL